MATRDPHEPDLLDTPAAGPAAIRGSAVRIIGYGGGTLLSLIAAALLLRHLGVDDSGRYIAIVSLAAVAAGLTDVGLATLGVRELTVRTGRDRDEAMRTLLGLRLVLTTLGVAGTVAFAVVAGYEARMVAGVAIAGLGVVLQTLQLQLATPLQSRLRLVSTTVVELIRQLVSTALVVVGVLVGAGLLAFVAVAIVAGAVTAAITARLVRGDVSLRPSFDRARWRDTMRDVLPYSAAVAAHVLYFRAAIIVVSLVASAQTLGIFAAAFRVVDVLVVLPGLAVGAVFPILARAARDDHDRLRYSVGRVFDASLVLGAWLALVVGLGSPLAISLVAGPDFAPAADVLRIEAAVLVTAFVGAVWGYTMLALGLYRQALRVNACALVAGCVLAVVLTKENGAIGAATATVMGELVLVGMGAVVIARAGLLPPLGVVPRVAVAVLLAVAPAVVFSLSSIPAMLVGTAIYFAVVSLLRALPDEVRAELRRRRVVSA